MKGTGGNGKLHISLHEEMCGMSDKMSENEFKRRSDLDF
jgi:hypothetical protein